MLFWSFQVTFHPLSAWWTTVSASFTGMFLRFYGDFLPVIYSSAAISNKKVCASDVRLGAAWWLFPLISCSQP